VGMEAPSRGLLAGLGPSIQRWRVAVAQARGGIRWGRGRRLAWFLGWLGARMIGEEMAS
jgi:hypothetical protein